MPCKTDRRCGLGWLPMTGLLILGCGGPAPTSTPPEASPGSGAADSGVASPTMTMPPSSATVTGDLSPSGPKTGGLTLPPVDGIPKDKPTKKSPESGGMTLPGNLNLDQSRVPASDADASMLVTTMDDGAVADDGSANLADVAVDLSILSWADIRDAATKTGKVTVVDLWSLSCAPCLAEFPNLVALQKRYPDRVCAIGANLDFDGRRSKPPETYEPRVRAFLQSAKAEFANYIVSTPAEDVYAAADVSSIPSVLVFDAQGNLVGKFSDSGATLGFSYEKDIHPLVERLL